MLAALAPVGSQREAAGPHTVDISQPRGVVSDLLVGGFRDERLGDIAASDPRTSPAPVPGATVCRLVGYQGPPPCAYALDWSASCENDPPVFDRDAMLRSVRSMRTPSR